MFRISRRLDYGLHLMVALANDKTNLPQSTASLAEGLQMPLPFMHQIAHSLMQAGLIKATPGPRGGLRLNQSARDISVLQVVEALEGPIVLNPCVENDNCSEGMPSAQVLWNELQDKITDQLASITLEMLTQSENTLTAVVAD